MSFEFRGSSGKVFEKIYNGVLRDLGISDKEVEEFIRENRELAVKLAQGERSI